MSDTSEIINGCLSHYDSRHIQVRKDFFDICAYDPEQFNQRRNEKGKVIYDEPDQECMAKILRILETLTDARKTQWYLESKRAIAQGLTPPSEPKEYPIPLTYSAIYELLYGTHGDNTIRNCVAVLKHWSYIKWYQETSNSIPCLTLNTEVIQTRFKQQAEQALAGVEFNSQPTKPMRLLNSKRQVLNLTANRPNSTPTLPEFNSQEAEFNTNNNSKNNKNLEENNKKERVASATSARALSEQEEINVAEALGHDLSMPHHIVNCKHWRLLNGGLNVVSCQDFQASIDAHTLSDTFSQQGDDDASSVALPAVAPGAQPANSPARIPAALLGDGTLRRDPLPETTTLPTQTPFTQEVGTLTKGHHEIPHADPGNPSAEPVVPPEMPQASAVGTHATSAVPTREPVRREQTPFSVTSPSDGAVGSAPQSSGPRASGKGKAQQRTVTQAALPPAPKFVLTEQEQAFWGLWCQVWFNKDIPPDLTETAYKHVVKLAPHIKTAEQLDSLIKRAKKDLEDSQGLKRKTVFLGNLVTSYSGWKQEQKPPEQPKPKQAAPAQPLPVLRVLPPDRSKSSRFRSPAQTVGGA